MTAVAWLALAGAVLCAPAASSVPGRVAVLVRAGRLAGPDPRTPRRWPRRQWWVLLCGAAATFTAGFALGPVIGAAVLVGLLTVRVVVRGAASRRRVARRRRSLLAGVRLLAAELEAGSRPANALAGAALAAPDHQAVLNAAAHVAAEGGDVSALLLGSGAPELHGVARAWQLAEAAGVPLADVLNRLAADLAATEAQDRAVATALAGPRSTAALLAALPLVGLALGATMGADPLAVLLGSPIGRLVCCAGVLLDAAGVLWTQALLRRAEAR